MKRIALPRPPRGRPTLTVVIPCYNYGHFLPAAVQSILSQDDVDARVLIVDDASPDGSGDVAEALSERDRRVRVIRHARNAGHIRTYNDGLRTVDTEFVSLVSADDIVAPGSLGRAVALMQRHPAVGLVYGSIATFAEDSEPLPRKQRPYHLWRIWGGDEWIARVAAEGWNPIASPEAVIRTSAMSQVGFYNPALPHSGDLEYWLRIASRWDVGQIHGPIQAYYRVHDSNMHTSTFGSREADLRERLAAFRVLEDPRIAAALPTAPQRLDEALATVDAQLAELIDDRRRMQAEDSSSLRELRHALVSARDGDHAKGRAS
ncbi:glycosyltransferase family 2 protein [Microbacterium yannicii]|uniref:glycosyltransferase family 2 protein n=1 Tax=Microbacterium yannicii TaxID=671622 RepID=UPI0002E251F0|nr:glycosyltransferase family 2 protein [Microbacterium yannicii]